MTTIAFVTPAWQRYALSDVCFAQRADMMRRLAAMGIDTRQIVIADDENCVIAERHGFEIVKRDNRWLGRRWNDGYQRAAELGARYVVPVGSDTWLHPSLFATLPTNGRVLASQRYALVNQQGTELAELHLGRRIRARKKPARFAVSAWALPTELMKPCGYRPCEERIGSGCDGSTFRAIEAATGEELRFSFRFSHPLDVVAFRSEVQITPYERLVSRFEGEKRGDPWARLTDRYPRELVTQARDLHIAPAVDDELAASRALFADYERRRATLAAWTRKHYLPGLPSGSLLDVGCGEGFWGDIFADFGYKVTGFDREAEHIADGQQKYPRLRLEVADMMEQLPFGSFDVIFLRGLPQFSKPRLQQAERLLANLAEHLAPGGVMLLSVYTDATGEDRPGITNDTVFRHHTVARLDQMLANAGRTTVDYREAGNYRIWILR